jgi:hypothetical protein
MILFSSYTNEQVHLCVPKKKKTRKTFRIATAATEDEPAKEIRSSTHEFLCE